MRANLDRAAGSAQLTGAPLLTGVEHDENAGSGYVLSCL